MRPIEVEMVMSKIRKHELDHEPDIPQAPGVSAAQLRVELHLTPALRGHGS